jgi:hypothetical protein
LRISYSQLPYYMFFDVRNPVATRQAQAEHQMRDSNSEIKNTAIISTKKKNGNHFDQKHGQYFCCLEVLLQRRHRIAWDSLDSVLGSCALLSRNDDVQCVM